MMPHAAPKCDRRGAFELRLGAAAARCGEAYAGGLFKAVEMNRSSQMAPAGDLNAEE
jgi:hypothetical protein